MSDPAFRDSGSQVAVKPASQVIQPPNALRDRLGSRLGRIDPNAIAKAEAALKGLSSQFGQWLQDEVAKLEAARAAIRVAGVNRQTVDQLYTHAHDLKGLGATYEYPLVTLMAGSLCKLLGDGDMRLRAPLFLIDAHIDAIRASVRDSIKTTDSPIGHALVATLEAQVSDYLKKA